jgi:hypothetical protein
MYEVERLDLSGVRSDILRVNIFQDSEKRLLKDWDVSEEEGCLHSLMEFLLQSQPYALIKHPEDCRSRWWPAVILSCESPKAKVRFYDCCDYDLNDDQMIIPITERQFKTFASDRIDKENAMVGQVIVGLNNDAKKNVFMLGKLTVLLLIGEKTNIG